MKRILSLDGGGIRGLFTIEVLAQIEQALRDKSRNPNLVLADYFDFIGGTSTGAIIAASLSWGLAVSDIKALYTQQCARVFSRKKIFRQFLWAKYAADDLSELLLKQFSDDGEGKQPALMGTARLRTLLLIMMRNGATGSPWPVTNNPAAKYNEPGLEDCNLRIPLWRLIRASAAPTLFPPEEIELGGKKHVFIDGAITPFNNPSYLMFLHATLGCYNLNWETGVDKMLLVSVGTGKFRIRFNKATQSANINNLVQAKHATLGLIDTSGSYQDMLCRATGQCLAGEPIDSEIGSLIGDEGCAPWKKQFTYLRYNHEFSIDEVEKLEAAGISFNVDDLKAVTFFSEEGAAYAKANIKPEHFPIN
jgi:hypothetical protein